MSAEEIAKAFRAAVDEAIADVRNGHVRFSEDGLCEMLQGIAARFAYELVHQ